MTDVEIKALQDDNTKLKAENAKLTNDLATSQKLVKSLQDEIVEQEKKKITAPTLTDGSLPTFTHEKRKYQFIYPKFSYKGKEYTAAQAAKEPALIKELVEKAFGGLQEVLA